MNVSEILQETYGDFKINGITAGHIDYVKLVQLAPKQHYVA